MIPQAQQPRNNRALAHYYFPANHTNHANKIWTAGTRHRSQHLDSSRCRGKAQTSGQLLPANHTKNTNKHPVHSCASCHSRALKSLPSAVYSLSSRSFSPLPTRHGVRTPAVESGENSPRSKKIFLSFFLVYFADVLLELGFKAEY